MRGGMILGNECLMSTFFLWEIAPFHTMVDKNIFLSLKIDKIDNY
jgi:hypothetical protein